MAAARGGGSVSQSPQPGQRLSSEPDPLLAFFAEPDLSAALAPPSESANSFEPVENAGDAPPAGAAALDAESEAELRRRVERAERLLEKSVIELSSLKSDLATLVSAVEDIKRRPSRPVVPPARATGPGLATRLSRVAAAAGMALAAIGMALWSILSVR